MKLTIDSNFAFNVAHIQYSDSGELFIRLYSDESSPDYRYSYASDLGDGTASAKKVVMLLDFIRNFIARSSAKEKTKQSYLLMAKHLSAYGDRAMDDVTTEYLQGFITHLEQTGMKRGSVLLLFQKLASVLHCAYREGLFDDRVLQRVKRPKKHQEKKCFLTEKELARMLRTDLPESDQNIRDMFLFSCMTGLRFGDISNLRWKNVKHRGRHLVLEFVQQKTGTLEEMPLCEQAECLLRGRNKSRGRVFGEVSNQMANKAIKRWIKIAKVKKNVSFHTGRHTFCVMLLSHEVPIYTVQQLMGHIENTNMLYRECIPCDSHFLEHSDEEIREIQCKLNRRPSKKIGFKLPYQEFFLHLQR